MIRPVMMRHYKNNWIQTSSRVFFFLQVLWKRTNRNDSRTSSVFNLLFIFLHFSLLTWLNSHSSRKTIKREVCIHANISPGSFFMSRLWRRSMNLNNAINFIQDLENTGKKRIKFLIHKSWRTEKAIGKKYQSGPIALPSCHVMSAEANCHASRQTNVPN